jgi:hypothetical protein
MCWLTTLMERIDLPPVIAVSLPTALVIDTVTIRAGEDEQTYARPGKYELRQGFQTEVS